MCSKKLFSFVHLKNEIKTKPFKNYNKQLLKLFQADDQLKFCNSEKSEKVDKSAHRQYKDLKRTKTLLEILINKEYSSII